MRDMTAEELQSTFSIGPDAWRRIEARPDMLQPLTPRTPGDVEWNTAGFARWLAATHPDLAAHTPHLLRPAPDKVVPRYLGGSFGGDDWSRRNFVARWRARYGTVAVVYPKSPTSTAEALHHVPDAATVVVLRSDFNIAGLPGLEAADRGRPHLQYEPRWSELAAHVGATIPWWPTQLRRPGHLVRWKPGDPQVTVEVVTFPDWEPLHDMAYRHAKGDPVRTACLSVGNMMRRQARESALHEFDQLAKLRDRRPRGRDEHACMTIAAVPDATDPGAEETTDNEEQIREGVALLAARTGAAADDLTMTCLEQITMWSPRYLPVAGAISVTPSTAPSREWIARLEKAVPTALHRLENMNAPDAQTFVDPVTGTPATRKDDHSSEYQGYALRRLPPGARLGEVILDYPVWIRTESKALYPAPVLHAPGASWGYSGSGPGTLAALIGRLLDDGTAPALTYGDDLDAEPHLEAFLQHEHALGTRLPRELLETVRRTGPDGLGPRQRKKYGLL